MERLSMMYTWYRPRTSARLAFWLASPLIATILVALSGTPLFAATITVTGTTISDCTLPDAITAANTNAVAGNCAAGSGADLIIVPNGSYALSSGLANPDGLTATPSIVSTIVIS